MLATMVTPDPNLHGLATHPEDDIVLATAVSGHADYLCTRDRQLLMLRYVHSVAIVSPGELVDILRQHPAPDPG